MSRRRLIQPIPLPTETVKHWCFPGLAALFAPFTMIIDAKQEDRPPNFIVVLADDMGYGDAGCYGGITLSTPHLDRLAERGMRFTDFHAEYSKWKLK